VPFANVPDPAFLELAASGYFARNGEDNGAKFSKAPDKFDGGIGSFFL